MAIDDINKLAPELLKKSKAQLEREIVERQLAMAELIRQEEVAAKEQLATDVNRHLEAISEGVRFLHANGQLHKRLEDALTGGNGSFMPSAFLRPVTAEQLVGGPRRVGGRRKPGEPRKRRRRNPETGELE